MAPWRDAEHVRNWSVAHGSGFWVGRSRALKFFTWRLHALVPLCLPGIANLTLIDVGAAIHNLAKEAMTTERIHSDDSDALMYLWTFHHAATVHAYEANAAKADELGLAARSRPTTRAYASHLHVHNVAVGARTGYVTFKHCGHPATYEVGEPAGGCTNTHRIWQTTLDSSFPPLAPNAPFILYVKIDIEGGTLDALKGMTERLEAHATPLVSVEYALTWDAEYWRRGPVPADKRRTLNNTLEKTQRWLDEMGYDVYLLHAEGSGRTVTAVPVHGRFWHPDMEICFNRALFYGNWGSWCWNDLLVVSRYPEHRCVRDWVVGKFAFQRSRYRGEHRRPS